jgi:hypothetical protein
MAFVPASRWVHPPPRGAGRFGRHSLPTATDTPPNARGGWRICATLPGIPENALFERSDYLVLLFTLL